MLAISIRVLAGSESSTVQTGRVVQVIIERAPVQVGSHPKTFSHRFRLVPGMIPLGFFVCPSEESSAVQSKFHSSVSVKGEFDIHCDNMLLPFAERAYADDSKFLGYCLNIDHPYGKHKARVFRSALDITVDNWEVLRDAVLTAVLLNPALYEGHNSYGELYAVDFEMMRNAKVAMVRSNWIIHDNENFPRLTSCYVIS